MLTPSPCLHLSGMENSLHLSSQERDIQAPQPAPQPAAHPAPPPYTFESSTEAFSLGTPSAHENITAEIRDKESRSSHEKRKRVPPFSFPFPVTASFHSLTIYLLVKLGICFWWPFFVGRLVEISGSFGAMSLLLYALKVSAFLLSHKVKRVSALM